MSGLRETTTESDSPRSAMVALAAFAISVGVVSWLVSGVMGHHVPQAVPAFPTNAASPSPLWIEPDGGALAAVTCVNARECWAVGSAKSARPLIVQYTASGWSTVSNAGSDGQLTAVTCVSADDCWAVGNSVDDSGAGATHALAEHYTGSDWTVVRAPDPGTGPNVVLSGVACPSAADCWAVGDSGDDRVVRQLIEHYDGSRWVVVGNSDPAPDQFVVLNGVACVSNGECWAVGSAGDASVTRPVIEESTGSDWVPVDAPNPSPDLLVGLNAVTCTGQDCWAVGSAGIGNPMLLEHLTGSAEMISANSAEAFPLGVACGGAEDCWSVGGSGQPLTGLVLPEIVRIDRVTLIVVVTPNAFALMEGESSAVLNGVSCVSSADCWAVGSVGFGYGVGTLIEQYKGRSWRVVSPLDRGP